MTEKEEFEKIFKSIFNGYESPATKAVFNKLWSYFQSKQQEKIERVKGLKGIVKAIDFKGHTAEVIKKSDVLKIMEEK